MLVQVKQTEWVLQSFYYKIKGRGGLYNGWGSGKSKLVGEINNYKWPNELTNTAREVEILAVWMMLNDEGVWRTEWMR